MSAITNSTTHTHASVLTHTRKYTRLRTCARASHAHTRTHTHTHTHANKTPLIMGRKSSHSMFTNNTWTRNRYPNSRHVSEGINEGLTQSQEERKQKPLRNKTRRQKRKNGPEYRIPRDKRLPPFFAYLLIIKNKEQKVFKVFKKINFKKIVKTDKFIISFQNRPAPSTQNTVIYTDFSSRCQ